LELIAFGRRRQGDLDYRLGLFLNGIQRQLTFTAKIIVGPELDKMTVVAPEYFPGINRG
jgi:hypothetical protein